MGIGVVCTYPRALLFLVWLYICPPGQYTLLSSHTRPLPRIFIGEPQEVVGGLRVVACRPAGVS